MTFAQLTSVNTLHHSCRLLEQSHRLPRRQILYGMSRYKLKFIMAVMLRLLHHEKGGQASSDDESGLIDSYLKHSSDEE
jgi:hypothetical protein